MSVLSKMRSYDDDIDFRKVWRVGTTISLCILLLSLWGIIGRGLDLGLDFEGGTSWDVPTESLSVDDARDVLRPLGQDGAKIQVIGRGDGRVLRVQSTLEEAEPRDEVTAALGEAAGVEVTDITVSTVGPSWGEQVSKKAQRALVWFFIAITAYIAWRLEWRMAVGALASVAHDLIISVGFYALFQIEITPATVIAFLTILGYSLYDTIVVFDRMQENEEKLKGTGRVTYTDVASLSLNQVLMRSINSTICSLLPVLGMLFIGSYVLGAAALEEFAVALTVGITIGAFSSVLIAAPVVVWIKERDPRYREIRSRVPARSGPPPVPLESPDGAVPVAATAAPEKQPVAPGRAPALSGRPIPPRPRKKGKKR
ncbi:MAG: protein translocase subunit SecF [Acidimicrobiales bacterium]